MAWLVTAHYGPGGAQARLAIRDRHLAYLISLGPCLLYGGALLDGSEPSRVTGMFIALDCADRAELDAVLRAEPYHAAGLFESVAIARLQQFVPHADPDFLVNELARERTRLTALCGLPAAAPPAGA